MQLTPHFTLEEMTVTQVRGVNNMPPSMEITVRLITVCQTLEEVRGLLGYPIIVSSGYRCPEVNARVGGAPDSAHLQGYAADFICPEFGPPLKICAAIQAAGIHFDQLINEGAKGASFGWVHISVDPRMRGEVLTANFDTGKAVYSAGLPEA